MHTYKEKQLVSITGYPGICIHQHRGGWGRRWEVLQQGPTRTRR